MQLICKASLIVYEKSNVERTEFMEISTRHFPSTQKLGEEKQVI
jgi:hypothetical protein